MFSPRGLRVVKALEKYTKENPMFFDTLTILNKVKFTSLTEETLQATFQVDSSMCNGSNAIHGGYVASVVDVMCVYANLGKSNGRIGLTTNLYINYVKSAKIGDKIKVEVKAIKNGSMPILEAYLRTEDGDIVAKGTSSFVNGNEKFQKYCANVMKFDFMD